MKISCNWLKEYVALSETPKEIADMLTSIGLEVESAEPVESVKGGLKGVVAGLVLECVKHPDADRLRITSVDVGSGTPLQIVCGAPNVAAGQKVAVATAGAVLHFSTGEEVKIKKSKIRGVESFGMICAEDELGIGTSHAGIMTLDGDAVPGTPVADLLGAGSDTVFEIGLTPNRSDAASHFGVARDLAAYLRRRATPPDVSGFAVDSVTLPVTVRVEDSDGCLRYSGVTLSGVTVQESPGWLQRRLKAIGIRPKNNVVDVTNFVLHELGQPLHAFDADRIEGHEIVVRTCAEGTEFTTLDGETRRLNAADLMICDGVKPLCIAGVFGGLDSGVTDATVNVFLESACFSPVRIRRTARRHGLLTDSSFRFERGSDPEATLFALKRAAMLIRATGGGAISSEPVDVRTSEITPARVQTSWERIRQVVGKDIPDAELRSIVGALDMKIVETDGAAIVLEIPTFRVDVKREFDVIEDILRIYGYNNVEVPSAVHSTLSFTARPDARRVLESVSEFLSANGFREIMSNSLTSSARCALLETPGAENLVGILNPLSRELNVMRPTLLFGGLEAVACNVSRKNPDLKLFENGNVYARRPSASPDPLHAYVEEQKLAVLITGNESSRWWNCDCRPSGFFTLKSVCEKILARFGTDIYALVAGDAPGDVFADGLRLDLPGGRMLANMGVVSKRVRESFDVEQEVFFAEFDFAALMELAKGVETSFRRLPRFPEVHRDLALVIDRGVGFAALRDAAFRAERKLLKAVGLFDVYEGDRLLPDKKQYALSFVLGDDEKTLTDERIEEVMANLLAAFERETGASLRSGGGATSGATTAK
jgi:phenylalanyl-tRNA synthetase beta chain